MDVTEDKNLTAKQRIELFQSSMDQLVQENDMTSIRQMLHQRYLQTKAEQEAKEKAAEAAKTEKKSTEREKKPIEKIRGRQLAEVLRFGTMNQIRNRRPVRGQPNPGRQDDDDPLLNDPNVLFENFAHDDPDPDTPPENLPYFPDNSTEQDEDDEDSFRALLRNISWFHVFLFVFVSVAYVGGQKIANDYGFGGPYFIAATLAFLFINLRRKKPGELSAYSVFNPGCRSIPTVVSSDQPREQILLGFGPL